MPEEASQWVNAVAKLTEITQQGRLKWASIGRVSGTIGPSFVTNYKNRNLRLSRVSRHELGEFAMVREVTQLEFIDDSGNALWSFPESAALDDLYQAAKFQAAGVQDFLTDILKE